MSPKILITAVIIALFLGSNFAVYKYTKFSYLAVGENNGTFNANDKLLVRLKEAYGNNIIDCRKLNDEINLNDFLDVKSLSVKYFKDDGSTVFCIYE